MSTPRQAPPPGVVQVVEGRVSSRLTVPKRAERLLRRTATAAGCEYDEATSQWLVYNSRLARVIVALRKAGYEIDTVEAPASPASAAGSASKP